MQAVYFEKHGGLEALQYGELKDPSAGPGEVLVAVKACALNHLDIWVRQGLPGVCIPFPHISGSDVAGEIIESGKGAKRFKKGEKVILSPGLLAGHLSEALEGRDSYSPEFQILGLQTQGGYAEKVAVSERFVIPVSDRYSFEEWASFPLAALTAYHMLVTRADLKSGETVLIHAAGSGIGSFGIQIAKFLNAKVITTAGDFKKVSRAKKLGAGEVILYKSEDIVERVMKLTNNHGVNVIFDHIGPDAWEKNLSCLARGGRLVMCGATSGPKVELPLRLLYSKQFSILGCYMGSLAELFKVVCLAEQGALLPVIDQVFPLKDAMLAQQRMEGRLNFGKIILKI